MTLTDRDSEKLGRGKIAAFVLPAVPISALGLPLMVHLPPFYVSHVGLSAAVVGSVLFTLRLWDIITDPVLGIVSDRFPTRWGRRRHWIVIGTPIVMLATTFVFIPPDGAGPLHLGFWMFILYIGWTLITISHMSWGAELSGDYHERARVQGWREFALVGGMLGVLLLPAVMELLIDDLQHADSVKAMAIFILISLPIGVALSVVLVGERPSPEPKPIDWSQALRALRRNRPLRYILAADFLRSLAVGTTGTLYIWFATLALQMGGSANTLLLFYFATGVVAVPLWIWVSSQYGKHRTFCYSMIYGVVGVLPLLFFPAGNYWAAMIGFALYGVAYGAASFFPRAIMADIKDVDAVESGEDRTGVYFSLMTLTEKIGYATALLSLPLIQFLGVDTTPDGVNTAQDVWTLKLIYILVPAITFGLAGWIMWRFPLDKKAQEELQVQLADRMTVLAADQNKKAEAEESAPPPTVPAKPQPAGE